jgi:transcription elongation factor GreB
MPDLRVVVAPPDDETKIFFAAFVLLENEIQAQIEYRIVGSDERDHEKNNISVDSPLAQALLGKEMDDEVLIHTPAGDTKYFIVAIRY